MLGEADEENDDELLHGAGKGKHTSLLKMPAACASAIGVLQVPGRDIPLQVPLGLLVHLPELIPLPPVPPSAVFRCLVNNIGSLGNGCAAEVARGAYTGLTFWSFVSGHSA